MAAEAAKVSARFLGFAPERAAPRSAALTGVTELIDAIHVGIFGVSFPVGRFRHCRTAIARNRTPMPAISQFTPAAASVPGSVAAPRTSTTRRLTIVSPATHPNAKPTPLPRARGLSSTRTTATMGMGLNATAAAAGNNSPITLLSTAAVSQRRTTPAAMLGRPRPAGRSHSPRPTVASPLQPKRQAPGDSIQLDSEPVPAPADT